MTLEGRGTDAPTLGASYSPAGSIFSLREQLCVLCLQHGVRGGGMLKLLKGRKQKGTRLCAT